MNLPLVGLSILTQASGLERLRGESWRTIILTITKLVAPTGLALLSEWLHMPLLSRQLPYVLGPDLGLGTVEQSKQLLGTSQPFLTTADLCCWGSEAGWRRPTTPAASDYPYLPRRTVNTSWGTSRGPRCWIFLPSPSKAVRMIPAGWQRPTIPQGAYYFGLTYLSLDPFHALSLKV